MVTAGFRENTSMALANRVDSFQDIFFTCSLDCIATEPMVKKLLLKTELLYIHNCYLI
jgi:hypothetical protein